jgi:hypothetical protein
MQKNQINSPPQLPLTVAVLVSRDGARVLVPVAALQVRQLLLVQTACSGTSRV